MSSRFAGRAVFACLPFMLVILAFADTALSATTRQSRRPARSATKRVAARPSVCNTCHIRGGAKAKKRTSRVSARSATKPPCHPKGYMDPAVAKNFNAAMKDMKRAGIKPMVTSTWRSSDRQAWLYRCTNSRRCRRANPGIYKARPPGSSLHEAGFAVDIAGIASGPRGRKRITPKGRRIVQIMRTHGFNWRYGLADPAHFEANPRKHGYRSAGQAIKRSQSRCQVKTNARRSQT